MRTYTFDLEPGNRVFAWCWRGKDDVVFTSEFLTETGIDYRVVVEYDALLYLLLHIFEDWVIEKRRKTPCFSYGVQRIE